MIAQRPIIAAPAATRALTIHQALEWAFGKEHARLDLDVIDPDAPPRGVVGTEYVIWQRFLLGATVDTGGPAWGGSLPHHDAEVIAAFVANLDIVHGGRGMAVRIAELAKAGITPDWMPGAQTKCVPRGWRNTKHGYFADTEVVEKLDVLQRGRMVKLDVLWCPVTYTPTAQQIGSARRAYLNWWGALLALSHDLRSCDMLSQVSISNVMPPMTPWLKGA